MILLPLDYRRGTAAIDTVEHLIPGLEVAILDQVGENWPLRAGVLILLDAQSGLDVVLLIESGFTTLVR